MMKILTKRFRKRIAILLLSVFLIPLIPVIPVSAAGGSPFPFDYPSSDTFYPVDFVIKLTNAGSADYLRVRTDNGQKIAYWEFLETYTIAVTPDPFSKYTFYDDLGNVVDNPFIGGSDNNLLLVRDDYTDLTGGSYGIVVASNATLYTYDYGVNIAESDSQVYFYQNYMSMAATPTPTPTPEPEIDNKFPTFINAYYDNRVSSDFSYINFYLVVNRLYDEPNTRYTYDIYFITERRFLNIQNKWEIKFLPKFDSYDFINNTFTARFLNVAPDANWDGTFGSTFFNSSNYKTESDIYDLKGYVSTNAGNKLNETSERNYELSVSYDSTLNYEATAIYIINTDGSTTRIDGDGGETPAGTPTPIPSPTLVPQPSINPEPTVEPPDSGDDNNWTGLFGWFKKLIKSILSIPVKIVNGILNALKYIFIPDMNKVKQVYSDLNDRVGIQKPVKFDFDPAALTRPHNVYFDFHSIPMNGQESETTRVTIIDFKQVDDWLDTSAGRMIIKICKACFSLLLWAYMIYVFTKHIGAINYTDAQRLEGVYKRSNSFEGDDEDV